MTKKAFRIFALFCAGIEQFTSKITKFISRISSLNSSISIKLRIGFGMGFFRDFGKPENLGKFFCAFTVFWPSWLFWNFRHSRFFALGIFIPRIRDFNPRDLGLFLIRAFLSPRFSRKPRELMQNPRGSRFFVVGIY